MPFPLIPVLLGGAAVVGAIKGVVDGAEGVSDLRRASQQIEKARDLFEKTRQQFDRDCRETEMEMDFYRLACLCSAELLRRFLGVVDGGATAGWFSSCQGGIALDGEVLQEMKETLFVLDGVAGGLEGAFKGALGGVAASSGLTWLAGLVGTASTGTAISSLSGAAASNAILAWLGGGSLTAGGLGMLGGSLVLGGIAAAPVLLFMGSSLARKGEKALTQAASCQKEAQKKMGQMQLMRASLGAIRQRTRELLRVLQELQRMAQEVLSEVEGGPSAQKKGAWLSRLQVASELLQGINEVLRTPIFDGQGRTTASSERIVLHYAGLLA
jgi:hypothetical protein